MIRKNLVMVSTTALMTWPGVSVAQTIDASWHAELASLNNAVAGSEARGEASMVLSGNTLTISLDVSGARPGTMHLQHFHGFAGSDETSHCPTSEADVNDDGVIDLIETEPLAGITMVPFHDNPVSLAIVADNYPTADANGAYFYEQSVSMSDLEEAFTEKFPGQDLDFDRRVIFVHGVPEETELPDSVQSLGDVPAHITLPIACGEIVRTAG